jgi:glycosyltransferase involved in cell wall biosynthesis
LRNQRNLGIVASLNRGLESCRADWIARIDADDRALPQRLERQLAFVAENPDLIATSCLAYYINRQGNRVARTHHDLTSRAAFARYMAGNDLIGLLHPGALIRRDALKSFGAYRADYHPAEDLELWNRLSEHGLILVQDEVLMEYRVHADSISAKSFKLAHLKHQWVESSVRRRRTGQPELAWDVFLEQWNRQGFLRRLNHWREAAGRRLYREAGQARVNGGSLRAALTFGGAAALRPVYSISRLQSQLLVGRNAHRGFSMRPASTVKPAVPAR